MIPPNDEATRRRLIPLYETIKQSAPVDLNDLPRSLSTFSRAILPELLRLFPDLFVENDSIQVKQ